MTRTHERLARALGSVDVDGERPLEGRVWPLAVDDRATPIEVSDFPVCFYALRGGLVDEVLHGRAIQRGYMVVIYHRDYDALDDIALEAARTLERTGDLFQNVDAGTDSWEEDIEAFGRTIYVVLAR